MIKVVFLVVDEGKTSIHAMQLMRKKEEKWPVEKVACTFFIIPVSGLSTM